MVSAPVLFLAAWVGFGACGVWWEGKSVEMGSVKCAQSCEVLFTGILLLVSLGRWVRVGV